MLVYGVNLLMDHPVATIALNNSRTTYITFWPTSVSSPDIQHYLVSFTIVQGFIDLYRNWMLSKLIVVVKVLIEVLEGGVKRFNFCEI